MDPPVSCATPVLMKHKVRLLKRDLPLTSGPAPPVDTFQPRDSVDDVCSGVASVRWEGDEQIPPHLTTSVVSGHSCPVASLLKRDPLPATGPVPSVNMFQPRDPVDDVCSGVASVRWEGAEQIPPHLTTSMVSAHCFTGVEPIFSHDTPLMSTTMYGVPQGQVGSCEIGRDTYDNVGVNMSRLPNSVADVCCDPILALVPL